MSALSEVESKLGWISLPSGGCKPSVVCGTDRTRPRTMHGYLRRRGDDLWLYASDSYIAVGLKVSGTASEGWVPRPALEAIERGDWATQLNSTTWRTRPTSTGSTISTATHDVATEIASEVFPYESLEVPLHAEREPVALARIALDSVLTARLSKALGAGAATYGGGVVLHFAGPKEPIRVTSRVHDASERVGAQMPVRESS